MICHHAGTNTWISLSLTAPMYTKQVTICCLSVLLMAPPKSRLIILYTFHPRWLSLARSSHPFSIKVITGLTLEFPLNGHQFVYGWQPPIIVTVTLNIRVGGGYLASCFSLSVFISKPADWSRWIVLSSTSLPQDYHKLLGNYDCHSERSDLRFVSPSDGSQ